MGKLQAIVLVSVLLQAQAPPPTISKYDRGASITMLKRVKADLKEHYYDTTFRGMDLDKTFAEAEERLRSAESVNQAVAGIVDVLMRLNELARAVSLFGGTMTAEQAGQIFKD